MENETKQSSNTTEKNQFNCKKCGGWLVYLPGEFSMNCPHCGEHNSIQHTYNSIDGDLYDDFISRLPDEKKTIYKAENIHCKNCGALCNLEPNTISCNCEYCSAPIVISQNSIHRIIQPKYIIPFTITNDMRNDIFKEWISHRFWAPKSLKQQTTNVKTIGFYNPIWIFETSTLSTYTLQKMTNFSLDQGKINPEWTDLKTDVSSNIFKEKVVFGLKSNVPRGPSTKI